MIPTDIRSQLEEITGEVFSTRPCSGGCINNALQLDTKSGKYFLKYNANPPGSDMFEAEARGLKLLAGSDGPKIPKAILTGNSGDSIFILMEFIERGKITNEFWKNLGSGLAMMHRHRSDFFGEEKDNYIGSLKQRNTKHEIWTTFYLQERLIPQWEMARNKGYFNTDLEKNFQSLSKQMSSLFPKTEPALLHGDLWSGNFMAGMNDQAWIIDPAVYFGNREMDLAMSRLFGGFHTLFYESYQEIFPLDPEWQERIKVCNLYPLLVHVNLFGGGYEQDVSVILKGF